LSPYTQEEFTLAKTIRDSISYFKDVKIVRDDVQQLESFEDDTLEQILVIDVFEHVIDLEMAVNAVVHKLKAGGRLIVSVPTNEYAYFFGQKFDKEIGHVRHFSIDELKTLFEMKELKTELIKPYTYYYTSKLCSLFYDKLKDNRLGYLLMPILNCFSLVTERIPTDTYTEILAVFRKH
jgi:hypothetical protein